MHIPSAFYENHIHFKTCESYQVSSPSDALGHVLQAPQPSSWFCIYGLLRAGTMCENVGIHTACCGCCWKTGAKEPNRRAGGSRGILVVRWLMLVGGLPWHFHAFSIAVHGWNSDRAVDRSPLCMWRAWSHGACWRRSLLQHFRLSCFTQGMLVRFSCLFFFFIFFLKLNLVSCPSLMRLSRCMPWERNGRWEPVLGPAPAPDVQPYQEVALTMLHSHLFCSCPALVPLFWICFSTTQ